MPISDHPTERLPDVQNLQNNRRKGWRRRKTTTGNKINSWKLLVKVGHKPQSSNFKILQRKYLKVC